MLGQRVCRRTHCALRAPFEQPRQARKRSASVSFGTPAPPPVLRFSARTEGNPGIGYPHGPSLRSAWRCAARSACASRGRAQRWPVGTSKPLVAAPAAGWLRGEHARRSAHASLTDSPRLSEWSAPARSELRGAPRKRPDAGLPRRGRRLWGAFLCLLSCRATRKEVARRGESRPLPSTAPPGASKRKIHAPQSQLKQALNI